MERNRRLLVPALAAIAAILAGTAAYVLNDAPDEFSVRLRIQEQIARRIQAGIAALEGLSYQFIANQDLNEALYAYGKRENRYEAALASLSFTRHLESQRAAVPLLEEAFFMDYDEADRIPLMMTEDFLRPEISAVRRFVWERAVRADGVCVWMDDSLPVHRERYLVASRLIKRLKTGEPIGVLALLINSRTTAEFIAAAADGKTEGQIDLIVSPKGEVVASAVDSLAGVHVSAAIGESSYFETIMAQGAESGRLYVAWNGNRAAAIHTSIGATGLRLLTVFPGWTDFGTFRRILVSAAFAAAAAAIVLFGRRRGPSDAAFPPAPPDGGLPPGLPPLNERERRLLLLLASGLSNKEIASEFGIKEQTVKNYLGPLYEKLGVHDRVSALLKLRGAAARVPPDGST